MRYTMRNGMEVTRLDTFQLLRWNFGTQVVYLKWEDEAVYSFIFRGVEYTIDITINTA